MAALGPVPSTGPSLRAARRWPETGGRAEKSRGYAFNWIGEPLLWDWGPDDFHPDDIRRIFHEAAETLAVISTRLDRVEISRFLLGLGMPPDSISPVRRFGNMTWLMQAAGLGSMDIVRLLVDGGAEVGLMDEQGRSAEEHALGAGMHGVAAFLAALRESRSLERHADAGSSRERRLL
jgi:hypothetical protein